MVIIKLRDKLVAHDKDYFLNTNNIIYERSNVLPNDIVIYTNRNFHEYYSYAKLNIALLMESIEMDKNYYNYILHNSNKYDIIYTWSKELLDLGRSNIYMNLCGTTWLHENYRQIYDKTKLCSIIVSEKKELTGHKLRHNITDFIINNKLDIDLYGRRFNNLPQSTEANPKSLSNGKILALKDFMFSIAIENCKVDYEFTEKLIDCFLSGTVPIYWGCPSICNFFNINGILVFDTQDECINILKSLSKEKYDKMLPYIKENFEIAKQFVNFKINEDVLFKKLI